MGRAHPRRFPVRHRHGAQRHLRLRHACASSAAATSKRLISFLVIGVVAMMTLRGLTGIARISLTDPLTLQLPQSFSQRLPEMAGLRGTGASLLAIAIGSAIAAFAFTHRGFRAELRFAATGAAIGALIALGWWATGIAGFDSFDTRRIESFTFVGPLGETLYYFDAVDRPAAGFPGRRGDRRGVRRLHRAPRPTALQMGSAGRRQRSQAPASRRVR